jgi:hypothetical protein
MAKEASKQLNTMNNIPRNDASLRASTSNDAALKLGYLLELSPGLEVELVARMFDAVYDHHNVYVVNIDFKNDERFMFWAEDFFRGFNRTGNIHLTTVRSSCNKIRRVDVYARAIQILISLGK